MDAKAVAGSLIGGALMAVGTVVVVDSIYNIIVMKIAKRRLTKATKELLKKIKDRPLIYEYSNN